MSRFSVSKKGSTKTVNYEGEKAYKLNTEIELYSLVCAASLQKKFYEDEDETLNRLRKLIVSVDTSFVCKLAVYAREEMYLRSIPLVLMVELMKTFRNPMISETITRIIQRPDEIVEILAYFQESNNRTGTKKLNSLPSNLKKGIARAFNKFNEYQFAKYNRNTEIKLRDAMFLTHPKPVGDKQKELFKKIADNTLKIPDTWEVTLSKNDGVSKKEKWERLIDEGKLGYMAALRNLRNIMEEGVGNLNKVLTQISTPENVLKSKQFPFRFVSAYRAVEGFPSFDGVSVQDSLEKALQASAKNISGFDSNTNVFIACDVSGSMDHPLSSNSAIRYYDIGLILGMLFKNSCSRVINSIFGSNLKIANLPSNNILGNLDKLDRLSNEVGWSTNGWKVMETLINADFHADKVLMFTDMQLWDDTTTHLDGFSFFPDPDESRRVREGWYTYKTRNPKAKLYIFDLAGYGNTPIDIREKDVHLISGWSDKIFDILDEIEHGGDTLDKIKSIEI
jgi:60 kDa SS-A/Ro ribonucleoprotein